MDDLNAQPTPTDPPEINTDPLPSASTQAAPPPLKLPQVLGSMFQDHDFQSASTTAQRSAIDHAASQLDRDYQGLSAEDRSAYVDEVIKGVPSPDPLYYKRMASKIYTPLLATAGGLAAEAVPGAAATGPVAPSLGIAAGLAASHAVDTATGIRKPISTTGGVASETARDLMMGGANVAAGMVLGPFLGGMDLSPADRELVESAHNLGVEIPAESVGTDNPIVGTVAQALRVLPGSRQVAKQFDESVLQQMIKAHKSILENGDVNMGLEEYGNAIQKHLDDFVRNNTNMNTTQALQFKNAILKQHGSPLSYDELGQTMQNQAQGYFEGLGKHADALYEHAQNSFDPDFEASVTNSQEAAHNMRIQALESAPQFQNSQTNSLLKDLSGQAEVEAMIAKRQAEIQAAVKQLQDQGIKLDSPQAQALIPQPISNDEIAHFLDNRTMPLSKFIRLQSDLGKSIRAIDQSSGFTTGPTPGFGTLDSGMLKQVHTGVKADIEEAFKQSSPQAQDAYDAAKEFYKFYMGETDKKALQSVLRSQTPETIYDGLVKPGMTTGIDLARRSMTPATFAQIQDRHISDFLDTGIDPVTGNANPLTGAFVRKQIQDWTPETLARIHGPETTANLLKLPGQLDTLPPSLPENPVFKRILNGPGGPSVIDALFKKGGTQNVADVMNAMDEGGQSTMRQAFLARILRPDTHGNISGTGMDTAVNNFGQDMMDLMFTKAEQKPVRDFVNMAYRTKYQMAGVQNPPNTAGGFMAGHFLKFAMTNPVKAMMQFLPTESLARAYYSPLMQNWLKEGIMPMGRQAAQPIANLIGGVLEGGGDESARPLRR